MQTIDKLIDTAEVVGQALTGLPDEDAHRIGNAFAALCGAF
ncbi:hypothetical protein [Asticcacaulis sp.]|nr:hypothetical protein [Asticcacaulis sp.]HTM82086.1 hypothetical protein [Asticcacaulis sp.]